LGILLVAAVPALLSYAIIEGPDRGWAAPSVLVAFALAALLVPAFLWRTAKAHRPVLDLSLFAVRQFRLANASTLIFGTAFYGMLLGNVVFLQTVWHYSVLRAALAAAPSPLVVTAVARSASKLANRVGYRRVLMAGAVSWAAGCGGFAVFIGGTPHWLVGWLPWALLFGLGVGLTLPVQSTAAVASLSADRYAIGSAVNSSFRQLGAVLGISLFVAVLGRPTALSAVGDFHRVWWVFAAIGLVSGLVLFVPRLARRGGGEAPAGVGGRPAPPLPTP
jgi:MFS family permease